MALSKTKVDLTRVPDVIKFYFDINNKKTGSGVYSCNKCGKKPVQRLNTGYTNLRRHLASCIGKDYVDKFDVAVKSQQNKLGFQVVNYVSERELVIYKWLKWVVMRDMPFTEVDNELTRELTGMQSADHVSSRSITTYIQTLLPLVEGLISDGLPQRFAIMFDGWKDGTTHFVAVIAVFMQGEEVKEILLGFSPPLDERTYTAVAHRDLLVSVLNVYSRTLHDVVVLIGDNCATNRATADLLDVPLLGCACHKLNLAIKKFVNSQPGVIKAIDSVASLASKASNLKAAAALRELTDLVAVRNNDTRWSSTYCMLDRFFEIEMHLRQVPELEMPRQSDLQLLRELLPTLKKLNSVMVGLQTKGVSVASARGTLNEVLEDYPELGSHLAQDAKIVHNPMFESAVTKVLNAKVGEMSPDEVEELRQFELPATTNVRHIEWGDGRDYYAMIQERKRKRLEA